MGQVSQYQLNHRQEMGQADSPQKVLYTWKVNTAQCIYILLTKNNQYKARTGTDSEICCIELL
jgi:hypothetical protein